MHLSTNPFDCPASIPSYRSTDRTMTDTLFGFEGRIPRSTYWVWMSVSVVLFYVAVFLLVFLFGEDSPVSTIGTLALYVPFLWTSLALQVKRWHDRDYSGWMMLIGLIPIIGGIWSFIELGCLRGTEGDNTYGADPTPL